MSRRAQQDNGFMLIELLTVMVMFVVVLSATLVLFNTFEQGARETTIVNEQIEVARDTSDKVSRQLRNLAKPTSAAPSPIRLADDYDTIFQTSDPTRTWVRYCLDAKSPKNAQLWSAESAGAALPNGATGPCPGNGWAAGSTRVVASGVVNKALGKDRPVFSYTCRPLALPAPPTPCAAPPTTATYPRITGVTLDLFIDHNVTRVPEEEEVSTSVYLRNQNEAPTASFTWLPSSGRVFLNASASADPEGRTLRYYWFGGTVPTAFTCEAGPPEGSSYLSGVTVTYPGTGTAPSGSSQSITLVVCDPGDLSNLLRQTVDFP